MRDNVRMRKEMNNLQCTWYSELRSSWSVHSSQIRPAIRVHKSTGKASSSRALCNLLSLLLPRKIEIFASPSLPFFFLCVCVCFTGQIGFKRFLKASHLAIPRKMNCAAAYFYIWDENKLGFMAMCKDCRCELYLIALFLNLGGTRITVLELFLQFIESRDT